MLGNIDFIKVKAKPRTINTSGNWYELGQTNTNRNIISVPEVHIVPMITGSSLLPIKDGMIPMTCFRYTEFIHVVLILFN